MAFYERPEIDNNLYVKIEYDDILLLKIPSDEFHEHKHLLYKTILGKLSEKEFVSFTQTKKEVSLFISKSLLNEDELEFYDVKKDQPLYSGFRFYTANHGIYHIGVVNKISNIFIGINIPILYVNSYGNNYILIESRFKELAIQRVMDVPNFVFVEN